jgi:AraC-like DNA-binding protein
MAVALTSQRHSETKVWKSIQGTWQQMYGDFRREGVSVEWHDFEVNKSFDWSQSFHDDSLEICLNLAGDADISHQKARYSLQPHFVGVYCQIENHLNAKRNPGVRHRFITIELSRDFLLSSFGGVEPEGLSPVAQSFLGGGGRNQPMAETRPMTVAQQTLSAMLNQPPVPKAGQAIWYRAKVLEVLSQVLFVADDQEEMFCMRQKRVARERVDKVKGILARDLENPPTLEQLGREVGCSSFYLSRLFSQEAGMTVPQYLRKIRMEKAGELLLTGKFNVSEVAIEVGYNSLSHFSRAFCQTMGTCPTLYAAMKLKGALGGGALTRIFR